jgi:hypothetical protein
MFDWEKALKISKITLYVALGIFMSTAISNSYVGKDYFEWIITRRG